MKILHTVESYDPANHGMQQVVKQLSERLFKAGHQVTIATRFDSTRRNTIINGIKIEQFKITGKEVDGFNAEMSEIQRYRNYLINSDFDIITNFAAQQWATDIALPILQQIKAVKIFVPTGFSELHNTKYKKYYESMKIWLKEYDMNIFLSNNYQDINFAVKNGIEKTIVIPNGASAEEFLANPSIDIRKKLKIPQNHFLILHVGSHTGLKGHREAIRIFKKAKIENATLLIIGNENHSKAFVKSVLIFFIKSSANIFSIFTGRHFFPPCSFTCNFQKRIFKFSYSSIFQNKLFFVQNLTREETVSAYLAANLFLFPSNIECSPLVLFESMASKTPFLTTDVGNAKEIISWSKSGILLPTKNWKNGFCIAEINRSANILEKIFADSDLYNNMITTGFDAFQNNYTWEKITKEYELLYYSLIGKLKTDS
jgi:glycosyltransferase involved in cell wall biosynthesis